MVRSKCLNNLCSQMFDHFYWYHCMKNFEYNMSQFYFILLSSLTELTSSNKINILFGVWIIFAWLDWFSQEHVDAFWNTALCARPVHTEHSARVMNWALSHLFLFVCLNCDLYLIVTTFLSPQELRPCKFYPWLTLQTVVGPWPYLTTFYLEKKLILHFQFSLIFSLQSHDPSEIFIICWFAAQETFSYY